MTHQEQIESIRAACIKVNPEIQPPFFTHPSHGRPIRLADVLLAIDTHVQFAFYFQNGDFIRYHDDKRLAHYDLRADDLTLQSPETITFLSEILNP